MNISLKKIISAFSLCLDIASSHKNDFYNECNHTPLCNEHDFSTRANGNAFIALSIARELNLSDRESYKLYLSSMLHDFSSQNIISEVNLYLNDYQYNESSTNHDIKSVTDVYKTMKYRLENYDGSGLHYLKGDEIPVSAQILRVSNIITSIFSFKKDPIKQGNSILKLIKSLSGTCISPNIAEIFLNIAYKESFWLELFNLSCSSDSLDALMPSSDSYLSLYEFEAISRLFARIIDSKSSFTASHSKGISALAYHVGKQLGYDNERCLKLKISGLLHDIGKLAIPSDILDKDGPLTEDEFSVIKAHPFYTRRILDKINNIGDISLWASTHHEKLDGSGYPYHLAKDNLPMESRIICVCDIYQALIADRPYREGMSKSEAFTMLDEMASIGKICPEALSALKNMVIYNEK